MEEKTKKAIDSLKVAMSRAERGLAGDLARVMDEITEAELRTYINENRDSEYSTCDK